MRCRNTSNIGVSFGAIFKVNMSWVMQESLKCAEFLGEKSKPLDNISLNPYHICTISRNIELFIEKKRKAKGGTEKRRQGK